jgi:hypothetical protein
MRVGVVLLIALALLAALAYADYLTNYVLYAMWSPTYTFDNFGFYGISVTLAQYVWESGRFKPSRRLSSTGFRQTG